MQNFLGPVVLHCGGLELVVKIRYLGCWSALPTPTPGSPLPHPSSPPPTPAASIETNGWPSFGIQKLRNYWEASAHGIQDQLQHQLPGSGIQH